MYLTTSAAISLALGESFNGPQLILVGIDATGWSFHWSVAAAAQATPILDMTLANGLLTLTIATANGVTTSTVTPNVPAATIAGLTPGFYQHDAFATDAAGRRIQLLGPAAFSITSPITRYP